MLWLISHALARVHSAGSPAALLGMTAPSLVLLSEPHQILSSTRSLLVLLLILQPLPHSALLPNSLHHHLALLWLTEHVELLAS